jgi:glycoside/pentoside/hexuronide:cation symporter, GPH family
MTHTTLQQEERIPWKSRIMLSAGDAAAGFLQNIIGGGALTYYFTRVMGLSVENATWVWIIFGIWNAINDPLIGFIADRTKSHLGRRKPYIRYGAPIFAASFILFWLKLPAAMGNQPLLFAQLLIGLFLYDTLYTAIASALYLMPYEMAVSNKARSSIFIWKIIFMAFSMGLPLVVLPIIQPGPGDDPTTFRWIMCGLGILLGAIIFFSTWFYDEKHFQQDEPQLGFIKSLVESFKNIPFVIFLVSSFTVIYCQTGLMQGVLYYFDEIKVPSIPVFVGLGVGIVGGVFLWVNLRERWGVKKCLLAWLAIFTAGCFIMLILGRLLVGGVLSFFLIGIGFAGGMYLIPLMNGDVIDYDETRTGLRREGMYAGINSLVTKPAISLAQAAFINIAAGFGFDQTLQKGLQSTSAQTGILLGWMLVPGILLLVSFLATLKYPLAGASWEKTKKDMAQSHTEKEKIYLEAHGFKTN